MPKYSVVLLGSKAGKDSSERKQETPDRLRYRVISTNAATAVVKTKMLVSMNYPEYNKIEVESVTEVRSE